jgi:hypothetical protein
MTLSINRRLLPCAKSTALAISRITLGTQPIFAYRKNSYAENTRFKSKRPLLEGRGPDT